MHIFLLKITETEILYLIDTESSANSMQWLKCDSKSFILKKILATFCTAHTSAASWMGFIPAWLSISKETSLAKEDKKSDPTLAAWQGWREQKWWIGKPFSNNIESSKHLINSLQLLEDNASFWEQLYS